MKYNIIHKYLKAVNACSCISEKYAQWHIFQFFNQPCVKAFSQDIIQTNPESILVLHISYSNSIFLQKLYITYRYRCQHNFEVPNDVANLRSERNHAIVFCDFLISEYITEVVDQKLEITHNNALYLRNPIYEYNKVKCLSSNLNDSLPKNVIIAPDISE